jgi:hypothetical protein
MINNLHHLNFNFMKTIARFKLVSVIILTVFAWRAMAQQHAIQYFRSYDQRGINVFETSKKDTVAYDGFKFRIGAGFTQGFQALKHSNNASAILVDGSTTYIETAPGSLSFVNRVTGAAIPGTFAEDANVFGGYIYTPVTGAAKTLANTMQLYELDGGGGFPLAQANLNFDVQLTDGVRLNLVSYMSSHHHNEFWVKGGFLQVDKVSFLNSEFMNKLWEPLTLKVGHMEVNYGDAHFRRSDNGATLQNPFMENNIMDEFTTEIGAELYFQKAGFLAMGGYTDGEIQGNVSKPNDRKPSLYGKVGYDNMFGDFRVRVTGSMYYTKSSVSNTLFGGDRTGSNYQYVMDPTTATLTGNAFGGRFNPGFRDNVSTIMINPFVKFKGIEVFGTVEFAQGNTAVENGEIQYSIPKLDGSGNQISFTKLDNRTATQTAFDVLYRFGKNEKFYVGAKYNKVDAEIALGQATNTASYISQGTRHDVSIDRLAIAAGWFVTKNILLKAEYVKQNYTDFPGAYTNYSTSATGYQDTHILSNGKFSGFVVQGAISF